MYNINWAIGLAMSFLTVPIVVTDTRWIKDESTGSDNQSIIATRKLNVPVDPNNSKQMQQIFGGSVSDGDIMILSSEPLYIEDLYEAGERNQQSFVDYGGLTYRVSNEANWEPQAGMKVYLAKRHVKQELV